MHRSTHAVGERRPPRKLTRYAPSLVRQTDESQFPPRTADFGMRLSPHASGERQASATGYRLPWLSRVKRSIATHLCATRQGANFCALASTPARRRRRPPHAIREQCPRYPLCVYSVTENCQRVGYINKIPILHDIYSLAPTALMPHPPAPPAKPPPLCCLSAT